MFVCTIVALAALQESETVCILPAAQASCGQCTALGTELDALLTAVQLHQEQTMELMPSVCRADAGDGVAIGSNQNLGTVQLHCSSAT